MYASTIFDRATAYFNTAMDAHLRAIAEGKQSTPPDEVGITLFATMWYGDSPRTYRITAYRIHGQRQVNLESWDHIRIQPAELDEIAKSCGYVLAQPPVTSFTHKLIYRSADPDQPPSGYSAKADQWARHNAHKMREAAIMAAGSPPPAEQRIKVVNVGGMTPNSPGIWYCGREWAGWKASVMENRHHISKTVTREEAAEKFADDLWMAIQNKGPMYWELVAMQRKLEAGETVKLGCWCAPKVCHCDRIRKAVLWLMTQPAQPTAPICLPQQPAQQPHYMVAAAAPVLPVGPKAPPEPDPVMREQMIALGYSGDELDNLLRMPNVARNIIRCGFTPSHLQSKAAAAPPVQTAKPQHQVIATSAPTPTPAPAAAPNRQAAWKAAAMAQVVRVAEEGDIVE